MCIRDRAHSAGPCLTPARAGAGCIRTRPPKVTKLPMRKEPCRWRSCVLPLPAGTPDGDKRLHVSLGKGPACVWPLVRQNQVGPGDARGVQQSILRNEEVNKRPMRFPACYYCRAWRAQPPPDRFTCWLSAVGSVSLPALVCDSLHLACACTPPRLARPTRPHAS